MMKLKDHEKAMKAYREHSENLTDEEMLEWLWEASEGVHYPKPVYRPPWQAWAFGLLVWAVIGTVWWWFR